MVKPWDSAMKRLVQSDPQAFVSLFVGEAYVKEEVNRELIAPTIAADVLYVLERAGAEMILHVEFQRHQDPTMGRRLWQYNALTDYHRDLPVYSIVVYLVKSSKVVEPPYERKLATGEVIHSFNFRNIKLWELPSSTLHQPGLEGMLPLLPLTREGRQHDTVEEMITAIKATGRTELLQIGFNIAGLVFKTDADKEWLKGRFKNMYDILEESWVYQEILEKGMQKGIEQGIEKGIEKGIKKGIVQGIEKGMQRGIVQGIRQMLGRLIEKRFPSLSTLAQQSIQYINDPETLQGIYDKLIDVNTVEEARQVLLSIEPNTR